MHSSITSKQLRRCTAKCQYTWCTYSRSACIICTDGVIALKFRNFSGTNYKCLHADDVLSPGCVSRIAIILDEAGGQSSCIRQARNVEGRMRRKEKGCDFQTRDIRPQRVREGSELFPSVRTDFPRG